MPDSIAAPHHGGVPYANGKGDARRKTAFWALTVGSIGVVYGDIGTSPLYALREAVTAAGAGGTASREAVLGVLSLILWALIVVVTLKYVLILLRADNKGEGGTLALMALAQRALGRHAGAVVLRARHGWRPGTTNKAGRAMSRHQALSGVTADAVTRRSLVPSYLSSIE
jgi:hypothetical protein